MIFELLDARRKRVAVVTDMNLVSGVINRQLDDRLVKDVLDVEFTLELQELLKDTRYIMVSDTGFLRGNPVFRVYQKRIRETIQVVATSYTTDDLGGYTADLEALFNKADTPDNLLKAEFTKVGYRLILDGISVRQSDMDLLDKQLEASGVGIGDVLKELMLILDVYGEFVFEVSGDEVVSVGIRLAKRLGKEISRGLVEGINITDFREETRNEDIITAVEYTGEENTVGDETNVLTLNGAGTVILPKTKREAKVIGVVSSGGDTRYVLEDSLATQQYGDYNLAEGKMMPVIESFSDIYINSLDLLLAEAVRKLDGRNVPKVQYNIQAEAVGLDVGDLVEVQLYSINVNRYLDVLSVKYALNRSGRVSVTVGERIPSELERRFEEIGSGGSTSGSGGSGGSGGDGGSVGDGDGGDGDLPIDLVRGTKLATVIEPRTLTYTGDREEGISDWEYDRRVATWTMVLGTDVLVSKHDYYLSFNYVINGGYSGGHFSLGLSYQTQTARENRNVATDNSKPLSSVDIVADVAVEGTSGSVEIRLNDFYNVQNPQNNVQYYGNIEEGTLEILGNNIAFPIFGVYDSSGSIYYLPYLHKDKQHPTTQAELDGLAGYITDFKIVGNERNTVDPT